jgi:hypothetical protein
MFGGVDPLPLMVAVAHGRYEGQCGKCMRKSLPVAASDPIAAWTELKRSGWELHRAPSGGPGDARCPRCCRQASSSDEGQRSRRRGREDE